MLLTLFGYQLRGGSPEGLVHNLLMQLFTLGSTKIEVFETYFPDILITFNPRYVKHVLCPMFLIFTPFGYGGGGQRGLVHNLLMQCFSSYSSKVEVPETYVFDVVIA